MCECEVGGRECVCEVIISMGKLIKGGVGFWVGFQSICYWGVVVGVERKVVSNVKRRNLMSLSYYCADNN